MRTVAARAGVSKATVSRVISGSPLVRPETAALVQRIIDEMHFVPNASATTLKYGRSDMFGIIIANVTNPFFLEFIRDFEALLVSKQHGILLADAEFPDRIESSVRRMLTSQVDGVVVMPSDEEFGPYHRLALRNIPVVTIDRRRVEPFVSDISFRFDQGMLEAVSHLHDLGHRRIGLIGGTENLSTSTLRLDAFLAAIRKHKIPHHPEWVVCGNYRVDGGDEKMRELMALRERPSAVIAVNDVMALGALRAAHALGLSVPRDVSIIGFDDIVLADIVSPALTTVHLPRNIVAQSCMEAFAHMAKKPESDGLQVMVDIKLVVRQSTAAPPSTLRKARKQ
jgi:DNA-binding LacI/PurR family transcriptional regulator